MNLTGLKALLLKISVFWVLIVSAQGQDTDRKWIALSSPKGDLILAMPTNPSVQNDGEMIRAFCNQNGATLDFQVRRQGNSKDSLKFAGQDFDDSGTVEVRDFKIGKISGRTRVRAGDYYSISIYIAGKHFYQITASAESASNPVLKEFLSSIRVDDQPLMKQAGPQPTDPVRIDSLVTSTDVKDALKVADAGKISVTHDSAKKLETLNPGGPYSRMALILQKPRSTYTDAARRANVQGEIVLFVQLRADGTVGNVTVRKGLSDGLTENSIAAAKRIKFIPAQKNGQPVDFYVPLRYTFTIY